MPQRKEEIRKEIERILPKKKEIIYDEVGGIINLPDCAFNLGLSTTADLLAERVATKKEVRDVLVKAQDTWGVNMNQALTDKFIILRKEGG